MLLCLTATIVVACADRAPTAPPAVVSSGSAVASSIGSFDDDDDAAIPGPHYSLDVLLLPAQHARGVGYIRFRQPVDAELKVLLDTWVWLLRPNTTYSVQRAVDTVLDGVCTSTTWATLGTITTDARGSGFAALTRTLPDALEGQTFDIHFQVVDASGAAVLSSRCYQYTARR